VAKEKFDPYHAWLGIPKWDRPANAYRLLGIEVFEENRSVIEAAANRQMAYLQELSSGDEHIEDAQKLLGQVSKARVVLLNPEKKASYDKKLSEQLDSLPDTTGRASGRTEGEDTMAASAERSIADQEKIRARRIERIKLGFLGILILTAAGIYLFVRPTYLEVNAVDENGNELPKIPFIEHSPADIKKLEEIRARPAPLLTKKNEKVLFLIQNGLTEVYVNEYDLKWPSKTYPYEWVPPKNHPISTEEKNANSAKLNFVASSLPYLVNPSLTFKFKKIVASSVSAKLEGPIQKGNYAVRLDASGDAIPNEIGKEIPYPAEGRGTGLDPSKDDKRSFSTNEAYFRSSDRPNVKVLRVLNAAKARVVAISERFDASRKTSSLSIGLPEKSNKQQVAEKEPEKKKPESLPKLITVSGQFTAEDRDGERVGIEVELIKLDINGDGDINAREIRFRTNTGEDGAFELNAFPPLPDKVPTLRVDPEYIEGFKPIDPIPIPVEKAKDGQITLEIPPLIRKTITISGTVSTKPPTESAEGFIVFVDRNENGAPDEGEPSTTTGSDGSYEFTLPFFIEDYPKSAGGYSLDLVVVGAPPDAKNIEIAKDFTNFEKLNPKNWQEGVRGANFIATTNDVKIAIPENGMPVDENQVIASGSGNPFDPETESKAFLEHLGFSGDLPEEGSDEKPIWKFRRSFEKPSPFQAL